MTTEQAKTADNDERIKQRLLWTKVNEPDFAQTSQPQRKIYQSNSLNKAGVPMIPEDMLGGSSQSVTESKAFRNMSINPLVPVGMAVTVGCLIGMCKASVDRNMRRTQYYMRGRVAAQAFTIVALIGGAVYFGADPRGYAKPGAIPKEPDRITKVFLKTG